MQYLIGLTFFEENLQYKKIESFRRRFDQDYLTTKNLILPLLPPFKCVGSLRKTISILTDYLDEHFSGFDEKVSIPFQGVDIIFGKKGRVFLNPQLPDDFFFLQEILVEILEDLDTIFKRRKENVQKHSPFLTIGRFRNMILAQSMITNARDEFSSSLKMDANNISLFKKIDGQLIQVRKLYQFVESQPYMELNYENSF